MIDDLLKFVPPEHHKAYMALIQHVPFHARKLCFVGESGSALGYLLKKRAGVWAGAIVQQARTLDLARRMLDTVHLASEPWDTIPLSTLDAVLLCNLETDLEHGIGILSRIRAELGPHCYVIACFGDPAYGHDGMGPSLDHLRTETEGALGALGYRVYHQWLVDDGPDTEAVCGLLMAVPMGYEATEHARWLTAQGEAALAYEVIELAPCGPSEPLDARLRLHRERLQVVAAWLKAEPDVEASFKLMAAQESFYFSVYIQPDDVATYQAMGRCWHHAGDEDMARRILKSVVHLDPTSALPELRSPLGASTLRTKVVDDVPLWEAQGPFRILFLMNPRPHYGIDVLFDGLCDCLGDENVVDYPYKPWLHGEDTEQLQHYPCRFSRSGVPQSLDDVLSQLDGGKFDLILFADVEGDVPREEMMGIVHRSPTCPVAIVDALDEFTNFRGRVAGHLRFDRFLAYFKREKHRLIDYGANSFPLPFAYDGRKALENFDDGPREGFFWAGHRMFGARRLYLEALEARYGWALDQKFSPDVYIQRIRSAAMGLNCFGMGFDTVRYWELPAHGCMLLSDRLPIEIPFNFRDGDQAVYFDDLPDLFDKVDFYRAHPDEVSAIAAAGHAHFKAYHTNEARARQLLGWVTSLRAGEGTSTAR